MMISRWRVAVVTDLARHVVPSFLDRLHKMTCTVGLMWCADEGAITQVREEDRPLSNLPNMAQI